MCHRPDNSNIALLLQRKDIIVVLKEDDRLAVEFAGEIEGLLAVDEFLPILLRRSRVRVLEKARGELRAQDAGDGRVDGFNVEFA
jgi:hypothetical protein